MLNALCRRCIRFAYTRHLTFFIIGARPVIFFEVNQTRVGKG